MRCIDFSDKMHQAAHPVQSAHPAWRLCTEVQMTTLLQSDVKRVATGPAPDATASITLVDRLPFIGAAAAAGGFVGGGFFGVPGFIVGFVLGTVVSYFAPNAPKKA